MRIHHVLGLVGAGLAAAVAASAVAGADTGSDPIQDAWLFPGFVLPGFATGNLTGVALATSTGTLDYEMPFGDGFVPYTASDTQFSIPFVADATHQVVTSGSIDTPPVGTVVDQVGPYLVNTYISAPDGDFGDRLSLFNLSNTFISDQAGIEDYVAAFGHEYPLFDFPAESFTALDVGI